MEAEDVRQFRAAVLDGKVRVAPSLLAPLRTVWRKGCVGDPAGNVETCQKSGDGAGRKSRHRDDACAAAMILAVALGQRQLCADSQPLAIYRYEQGGLRWQSTIQPPHGSGQGGKRLDLDGWRCTGSCGRAGRLSEIHHVQGNARWRESRNGQSAESRCRELPPGRTQTAADRQRTGMAEIPSRGTEMTYNLNRIFTISWRVCGDCGKRDCLAMRFSNRNRRVWNCQPATTVCHGRYGFARSSYLNLVALRQC